ncbi:hypothetical protein BDQ12DRAFT_183217 [Crucibulum laeve]|uniref:C2H2-type domain-containing protein n=1 Tax=Crucibulum laeve TaxID=68775 RepID=A0A5C3MDH3_9AGAR|nr:hypothetical protein BDQ12DRAFT_183217 [Crucibulum laeve]
MYGNAPNEAHAHPNPPSIPCNFSSSLVSHNEGVYMISKSEENHSSREYTPNPSPLVNWSHSTPAGHNTQLYSSITKRHGLRPADFSRASSALSFYSTSSLLSTPPLSVASGDSGDIASVSEDSDTDANVISEDGNKLVSAPHPVYCGNITDVHHMLSDTVSKMSSEWGKYAKEIGLQYKGNGYQKEMHFKCLWRLHDKECSFKGNKQLIKRHIEGTKSHLNLAKYACNFKFCHKRFAQKNSLLSHITTHTGINYFPCTRNGCNEVFKDAPQEFRHRKNIHNYEPAERRKWNNKRRQGKEATN